MSGRPDDRVHIERLIFSRKPLFFFFSNRLKKSNAGEHLRWMLAAACSNRDRYLEPISLNIENEMTLVKFRISSYFAQIVTSLLGCFRKYHSKVLKRFSVFRKLPFYLPAVAEN